jgi:RNA recognition motif-containing protein
MNIRVSNIGLNATDDQIRRLFAPYGLVEYAIVYRNSLNGRSLKSWEVQMPVPAQAKQAIVSLDKTAFDGNIITVRELPAELY